MDNAPERRKYVRQKGKALPKQLEAIFILLNDARRVAGDVPLTPEEIDIHPITRNLPAQEKRLLVKHWPDWEKHCANVQLYRERIDSTTKYVSNTRQRVGKTKRSNNFDDLTLPERLQIASEIVASRVEDTFLFLAHTKPDEIAVDEGARAVYEVKVKFIKDMLTISKQMSELADRQQAAVDRRDSDQRFADDGTKKLLEDARKKALAAGVELYVDAEVDDGSE